MVFHFIRRLEGCDGQFVNRAFHTVCKLDLQEAIFGEGIVHHGACLRTILVDEVGGVFDKVTVCIRTSRELSDTVTEPDGAEIKGEFAGIGTIAPLCRDVSVNQATS